jgi:hypothetical protein
MVHRLADYMEAAEPKRPKAAPFMRAAERMALAGRLQ